MGSIRIRLLPLAALLAVLLLLLSGCGGGSGDVNGYVVTQNSKLTFKTSRLLADGTYGAMDLTLHFPNGISVQLDPTTGEPTPEVVKLTGASDPTMTLTTVKYSAATAFAGGTLRFQVFNLNGFSPNGNETIEVNLNIAPGFFPKAADFSFSDYLVTDLNGNTSTPALPDFVIEII